MDNNQITVGIIGGIGPESTVDYYKSIISGYRQAKGADNYPRILINSIYMTEMLDYFAATDYPSVSALLLNSIHELKSAGAHFAVIASNTPHVVFNMIEAQSPIPLISIVEATCQRAISLTLKKVLLIGTGFTMKSSFYKQEFDHQNIALIVPPPEVQDISHHMIFPELEDGIVIPEKKAQLIALCNEIIAGEQCDGIVLGCTELPLMLSERDFNIPVLNTTQIHVDAIVERMIK